MLSETRDEALKSFHEYWVRIKRIHEDAPVSEIFGHPISEVEARSQVELPHNSDGKLMNAITIALKRVK